MAEIIADPKHGLFERVEDHKASLIISKYSIEAGKNYLPFYRFMGRFQAMALFHGVPVGVLLHPVLLAQMLGQSVTLMHLKEHDNQMYTSLKILKDMSVDEMEFTMSEDITGSPGLDENKEFIYEFFPG